LTLDFFLLAAQTGVETVGGVKSSRTTSSNAQAHSAKVIGALNALAHTAVEATPELVEDIDCNAVDDPQECVEIVNDVYEHLRESELRLRPQADYLASQLNITADMRGILVDWLVEVGEEYRLSSETLYLAINYVDRYLSLARIEKSQLQLVGVAAMLIASKYEEIYPPQVDEFVYISDNTYTREQIFQMEAQILVAIDFQLTIASAKVFLRRNLRAVRSLVPDPNVMLCVNMLSSYLCELSLLDYGCLKYAPSMLAVCAVSLALHCNNLPAWSATLAHHGGHRAADALVQQCAADLHRLWVNAPRHPLRAVPQKYANKRCARVSTLRPPATLPQALSTPM
jgi:cyclin A